MADSEDELTPAGLDRSRSRTGRSDWPWSKAGARPGHEAATSMSKYFVCLKFDEQARGFSAVGTVNALALQVG